MITIRHEELKKQIKDLLRPHCKSVPKDIYIYDDSITFVWKNYQTCEIKAYVTSIYISKNIIELTLCNSLNHQCIGIVGYKQNTISCKEVVH